MSLIASFLPTPVSGPASAPINKAEAAEETRWARSNPTPESSSSDTDNQPVSASNPTQDNANAANSNPPVPVALSKSSTEAEAQSVVLAQLDAQDAEANAADLENQARKASQDAQVAYAQQALLDRLPSGSSNTTLSLSEAPAAVAHEPPGEQGTSLADLGEFAAADAEDPLAA